MRAVGPLLQPRPFAEPLRPFEWGLLGLVSLILSALLWKTGASALTLGAGTVLSLHAAAIQGACRLTPYQSDQIRLWLAFATTAWVYWSVRFVVPALGLELCDDWLRSLDEGIFGALPAQRARVIARPWLTEIMSFCYLCLHVYLFSSLIHALWCPDDKVRRLANSLFSAFAIGFAGYFLVPAIGPANAFPELFGEALSGGPFTRLNAELVASRSAVYDVFPSLHLLITCTLLSHDWREHRLRFSIMLTPSIGLCISTIYLGYHYALNLLVAMLFLVMLELAFLMHRRQESKAASALAAGTS